MAIVKQPQACRLTLKVENGLGAGGAMRYKTIALKNVKPTASDDDVFAVGSALASLQSRIVSAVGRTDEVILSEDE